MPYVATRVEILTQGQDIVDAVPDSLRIGDRHCAECESLAGSGARVLRCDGILTGGCTLTAVANTRLDGDASSHAAHDTEHDAGGAGRVFRSGLIDRGGASDRSGDDYAPRSRQEMRDMEAS